MKLPTRNEAKELLERYVGDEYQRYHAEMVATAMEGYAGLYDEDPDLWYVTGLLHDLDFDLHPETHPKEALLWFDEWDYPEEMIHAVEAHAYGYHDFKTLPETRLAAALLACDEISGIFYAYRKLNPAPYREIKASSIKKRLKDRAFAAKIDRSSIYLGVEKLGVELDDHIESLIKFFSRLA